jgi:hypothetical protein
MREANHYAAIGLKALQRAAKKVAENARKNNFKIPIWGNGRVEYLMPEKNTEQRDGEDEKSIH